MYARGVVSAYNAPAPAYPGSLTSSSLISPISLPPYPTPGASANNTPDRHLFALPMPRSRTPSNASASSVDDPSSRTGGHISGILAILCLAGCTDEHGVHSEPLRARFGEKLSPSALQLLPPPAARVAHLLSGSVIKRSTPRLWRTCTQAMEMKNAGYCVPLPSVCLWSSGEKRGREGGSNDPHTLI